MSQTVRTRFAPSPTGQLHIGNARTAIMNWIFARHHNGQFILRIEDTDQERSTKDSETAILKDIAWLGLGWDEGPDTGGDYGPYRQSERLQIYQQNIDRLLNENKAYPCYCTPEELDTRRKDSMEQGQAVHYDGKCRHLTDSQKSEFENEGRKPVIRFLVPEGNYSFQDLVKGEISVSSSELGDFVLMRAGGMPMYNFACAVDDHLMAISHVIRGDDHVINTFRQVLLFQALNWEVPQFAHTPMILGPDRTRLSKRHGATSVAQYQEGGYLPEAIVNFLSLLSWSSESGDEILSIDRLIEEFDFKRVSKSASVFDSQKLSWMNGMYIRNTDPEKLVPTAKTFLTAANYPNLSEDEVLNIVRALHDKFERFSEFVEKAAIFFNEEVVFENDDAKSVLQNEDVPKVMQAFLDVTQNLKEWNGQIFLQSMKEVQKQSGVKGKNLWMPVRVALTGQVHGPEMPRIVEIFGLEKCRKRIQQVLS